MPVSVTAPSPSPSSTGGISLIFEKSSSKSRGSKSEWRSSAAMSDTIWNTSLPRRRKRYMNRCDFS